MLAVNALPATAFAQNAAGNGHALDANAQSGTGGYNAPQKTIDYNARNAVITGNVPGLGYFHGNKPYSSLNEFGSPTGGDPFFRFNAESYPTSPTAQPYVKQGAPLPIFSSEAPTLSGQLGEISSSNPILLPREASPGPWTSAVTTGRDWSALNGYPRRETVLGSVVQDDGRVLEVNASPLLGMRYEDMNNPGNPRNSAILAYRKRLTTPESLNMDMDNQANLPALHFYGTQSPQQNESMFAPSLELGMDLENQTPSNLSPDARLSADRRLAQIQATLFSPLGSRSAVPGEDAYLDLLRSIRDNHQIAAGFAPPSSGRVVSNTLRSPLEGESGAAAPGRTPEPPEPPQFAPDKQGRPVPGPGPGREFPTPNETLDRASSVALPPLSAPSAAQLSQARMARAQALRRARNLLEPASPDDSNKSARSESAADSSDLDAEDSSDVTPPPTSPLGGLVSTLKYSLPPLSTLAGTRADRINSLLRRAESDMQAGKYFDAEGKYRLVLEFVPDQPLAAIGQVNAQLGAGMARSACTNLRALFEQHPEIIAAQYGPSLLPGADRLQSLRLELEDMIRTTGREEPALMLAYLGYQTRSPQLVRYGLDLAQARSPNDPLLRLVRSLWLPTTTRTPPAPQPSNAQPKSAPPPSTGANGPENHP